MTRFRIFEVTSGPTPYPVRFVVEEDRPTTADTLAAAIRATGALAVEVTSIGEPFADIVEANREATRLAHEHRTRAMMCVPPAPKRKTARRVVTRYFRRVSIGASNALNYPSAE